jgi:hypothetical protein
MDPFTLALATFGVQKLRGKSTKQALESAAIVGGGSYALGASGLLGPSSTLGKGSAFSSLGFGQKAATGFGGIPRLPTEATMGAQFRDAGYQKALSAKAADTTKKKGLETILAKIKEKPLESALIASTVAPLFAEDEDVKPIFTEEDYKQAYKEQSQKLEGGFQPVDVAAATPTREEVFGSNMFYANEGGLATAVNKFNQGGVNYLPSKVDHDENDVNNYVRAQGYVEDGAGVGDKDEDTMLAQLADGEFVSRADAVLGAGILSGADPKSFKGMRKAGADFFYNQQKQLKRIYDLVDGSKKEN